MMTHPRGLPPFFFSSGSIIELVTIKNEHRKTTYSGTYLADMLRGLPTEIRP